MATAPVTQALNRGGSFLITRTSHEDVFTPADLTDDQRLIGQTAEEFIAKEVVRPSRSSKRTKTTAHGSGAQESRRDRFAGRRNSGGIRRRGPRQNIGDDPGREARRPMVRLRSPMAATPASAPCPSFISAPKSRRKNTCRKSPPANGSPAMPLGAAGRFRLAGRAHPRRSLSRWQELDIQRPEDVDHQRRLRRRLYRLRENRRREILLLHRRTRHARIHRWRGRKKDGHQRQFHRADFFRELRRSPKKICCTKPGRGHMVAFNTLNAGRFGLAPIASAPLKTCSRLFEICEGAHGIRQDHRRFRPDQSKLGEMAIRIFAIESKCIAPPA